MPLLQRRLTVYSAELGGVLPAGRGEVTLPLHSALMRPHLEFWASQYKRAVDIVERVNEGPLR